MIEQYVTVIIIIYFFIKVTSNIYYISYFHKATFPTLCMGDIAMHWMMFLLSMWWMFVLCCHKIKKIDIL